MKTWLMELCPEIAEWQAELIAEECDKAVLRKEQQMLEFLADMELREKWKQFQSGAAIRSVE